MSEYFFWSGVVANVVGLVTVLGLLAHIGLEWWIKFSGAFKPLMQWYAERLMKSHPFKPRI